MLPPVNYTPCTGFTTAGLTSPVGAQFPVYAAQAELILRLMVADDRSQGSMPTRFAEWESRQRASAS